MQTILLIAKSENTGERLDKFIADIAITVGAGLLILYEILFDKDGSKDKPSPRGKVAFPKEMTDEVS